MSDIKTSSGKYLPEGIYIERNKIVFGNYHTYLVYRDGKGNAKVLRGGPKKWYDGLFSGLDIEINKDIGQTKDKYDDVKDLEKERHPISIIQGKGSLDLWNKFTNTAKNIDTEINYKIGSLKFNSLGDIDIGLDSQVCHSITGTILKNNGFNLLATKHS